VYEGDRESRRAPERGFWPYPFPTGQASKGRALGGLKPTLDHAIRDVQDHHTLQVAAALS